MTKGQKKELCRILGGIALFVVAEMAPVTGSSKLLLFLIPYFLVGGDVLLTAVRNIAHGQVFDENFLMGIATMGAFLVGEYPEGVAVMVFYQVGELFQDYAVNRSRQSISELMDIRPDYANVERDGKLVKVDPEEVRIGDLITVKAGEKIPLDSVVVEGVSMVDTSALTGESVPRRLEPGRDALSGCINQSGLLLLKVTKEFGESTVSKILDLVENAASQKAPMENFITKFARYYTPVVVLAAVLLALVPPLVIPGALWSEWVQRALIFLVISCPCALVISVPLGFFGGIGGASKNGVLVKGSNYLEALAEAEIVVFDKTGTLTKGTFTVTEINPVNGLEAVNKESLLEVVALAESYSNHPISMSIQRAYGKEIQEARVTAAEEIAGCGVKAVVDGQEVLAGNHKLMEQLGVPFLEALSIGTVIYAAVNGVFWGSLVIADEIKEDSQQTIAELKKKGIKRTVMLTGDAQGVAEKVAKRIGIDRVFAELLPGDKVEKMQELLKETSPKGTLLFVGDGINDAPVLALSDVGIAMGAMGSDAAIEAADIVLMDDQPGKLLIAMAIAKKTLKIVKQNIYFALGVKAGILLLGAFGIANMWMAVFADVGVAVIAILNSMRAMKL